MNFKTIIFPLIFLLLYGCSLFNNPYDVMSPEWNFEVFANTYKENYSLFELKGIDWLSVVKNKRVEIHSDMGADNLFKILCDMIDPLNDGHVWLDAGIIGRFGADEGSSPEVYNFEANAGDFISPIVYEQHYYWGRLKTAPETGYLHLLTLEEGENSIKRPEAWVCEIDKAVDSLLDCDSIIIDLRHVIGGYKENAEFIAERFTAEKTYYSRTRFRSGESFNDFTPWKNHYIVPRGVAFSGDIYIVTDGFTASAAEWMTLMFKSIPGVTHAGVTTRGTLSQPCYYELPVGWTFSVTIGQITDAFGNIYEDIGITPEIYIDTYQSGDPVLEYFQALF